MDRQLLKRYEAELEYIREMGGEFASQYPKIAGRLGLDGFKCADPYVERLLEGFAFLAARVQLKLDSEFPQLIQSLLEIVYPQVLAPTPSVAIVQFQPDLTEGALAEGYLIPRDTPLRGQLMKGEQTHCEFRTAHNVTLWPVTISRADYFRRDSASLELPPQVRDAEAGLRIRLRVAPGQSFESLALETLCIHLRGREELPTTLYEQLMVRTLAILVQPVERTEWQELVGPHNIKPVGFDPDQFLIPYEYASFQGYRLLAEYFLFHERYLFAEVGGLGSALRRCTGSEVDVIILFNHAVWGLANAVEAENLALFCTPAVNLFPKRADPIRIDRRRSEHLIVPDRMRPLDFEVFRVKSVVGLNADGQEREFHPFYSLTDHADSDERAYYSVRRTPRIISAKHKKFGTRTTYLGSDAYLSLVDRLNSPYSRDLSLLTVQTLCTNRDLPLQMPVGHGDTDFTLEMGAPVRGIRCVTRPKPPRPSLAHAPGQMLWKLLSHLSLNYLSIRDDDNEGKGATALREMLRLYAEVDDAVAQKQIDGIKSLESKPIIRQLPTSGPLTFGRGLEIALTLEEEKFKGVGVFLLGAVLERFFAKYTSVNSFTETVLHTDQKQEVARWPMRIGRRHIL